MGRSFWSLFGGKDTMLFLKILRILNGIFVISVALSATARIFPIFRNKRTVMVNLFVLGMAGILTSLLFKQFSMVCISLAVSLHQLYTLEMYQRDARLRKIKKSMLRMKRRIDRLERRIGGDGDVCIGECSPRDLSYRFCCFTAVFLFYFLLSSGKAGCHDGRTGDDRVLFLPSGYRRLSSIGKQRRSDGEGSDGSWLNCWFNVCKFDGC